MAHITDAPVLRRLLLPPTSTLKTPGAIAPGNQSLSTSKAPNKIPGKNWRDQFMPSKVGGDRFIPTRNSQQMEVASFLLSKAHAPAEADAVCECCSAPSQQGARKAWATVVQGYDIEQAKILHLSGKPFAAQEGYEGNLKVLHSTVPVVVSAKTRHISSQAERTLDAPFVRNDFYLNLMEWGAKNILAVALNEAVYLWDAATGGIVRLLRLEPEGYVSAVSWSNDGSFLAVGTSDCTVQIWDVEYQKCLRSMDSHTGRVSSLSWNSHILSSGSRSGHIHHHDVTKVNHHVATLRGHSQEVCGLKWAPSGRFLASGGNDNLVFVWPGMQEGSVHMQAPVQTFRDHQGAVKALAWCPWQSNTLASGGGTSDQHIRIWNVISGSCLSALDTHSQISSLLFAPNYKELVSSHGFADDNITIWKYPTFDKVGMLDGHGSRILNVALSPDGSTIASLSADDTVRMWNCFRKDPLKKPTQPSGSITFQPLR